MTTTPIASFTRPANTTAYAAGDLVANSATAGSVTPMQFNTGRLVGQGTILRARLWKSATSTSAAAFKLHLFSATQTVTNGDNGAIVPSTARDLVATVAMDMTSGALVGGDGVAKSFEILNGATFDLTQIAAGERRLYGLLEATAAYTPASAEVFQVTLEITN